MQKIMLHVPSLYSINNGTDMSVYKLNQAFLIYFLYTEKLTARVLWNACSANIRPNSTNHLSIGKPFHKLSWKSIQYFLRYPQKTNIGKNWRR